MDYLGTIDFELPSSLIFLEPIGITTDGPAWRVNFKSAANILDVEASDESYMDAEITQKPHQSYKVPRSLAAKGITSDDLEEVENDGYRVCTMES